MKYILGDLFLLLLGVIFGVSGICIYSEYKIDYIKTEGQYIGYFYKNDGDLRTIVIKGNDCYYEVEEPIYARYGTEVEQEKKRKVNKPFEIIQEFENVVDKSLYFDSLSSFRHIDYINFIKNPKNQNLIINGPSFIITQRQFVKKVNNNPIEKTKIKIQKKIDKELKKENDKYEVKGIYN